jgi:serine/threonine-protein kinase
LGRYTLEREVAAGTMGKVWAASDPLGRRVAVKLVSDEDASTDPARRDRLAREARLLARVRHPNVITLLDFGAHDDRHPVLVMELVGGRGLDVVMGERGAVSARLAVQWSEQILSGLSALHGADIVHRDVKPANILVAEGEELKVIDLGVARSLRRDTERLTRQGNTVGSLDYMSPEQLGDAAVDARADVYAAGMMLYQMVSGALPSHGLRGAIARMSKPLPPPRAPSHLPALPRALVDVIGAMVSIAPADRPPSAAAAADRLARALRVA